MSVSGQHRSRVHDDADSAAADASVTAKDVQIIAKALGFLEPAPAGGVIAVIYSDAPSRTDAAAITALFAGGVASAGGTVTAKAIDIATLGDGSGYIAVLVAAGAQGDAVMAAAKAHHIPCISAPALVQAGRCVMAVSSDPKVAIEVNHEAAQAAGVSFTSAFRMLIHEI